MKFYATEKDQNRFIARYPSRDFLTFDAAHSEALFLRLTKLNPHL